MKQIFLTTITCFSLLFTKAQDNSIKQRTINITGSAQTEIVPDEIYVQVDLREYDKKSVGKIDIETIKNNFLAACKSIGLTEDDISVKSYQGYDNNYWLYRKNKKQNPDMKAGISYWVKVSSTSKIDQLVDKLDDEATQNFFIAKTDHSKIDELKKQLKIEAVKAAKNKAVYLAKALDEEVGEVLTINDPNEINQYPQPIYYANAMLKSAGESGSEPPLNIDFKKIKLQFEVNVVFTLK